MKNLPIVSIVGRPNVGKSTLFNRLVGRRQAIVANEPGTTRDPVSSRVDWDRKSFILIDTAGLINDLYGFEEAEIEKQAQGKIDDTILESDKVLFLIDIKAGITAEDKLVAAKLRKYSDKIILIINKCDNLQDEQNAVAIASNLGFNQFAFVSALNGRRSGDLLDMVTGDFKPVELEASSTPKIAIIGRANAGKSTLFNSLTSSEKAIVSEIPGTTRDSINDLIKFSLKDGTHFEIEIIDTAGFRKKGKMKPGVEKFGILRSIQAIHQSNIVLLVVDGEEGFTRNDAHLAQLIIDARKEFIVVINKMDLYETNIKNLRKFPFIIKNTMVSISAKNKKNLDLLIEQIYLKIKDYLVS